MKNWPTHARAKALTDIAVGIESASDKFADALVGEAAKPIREAQIEVSRAAETFRVASAEAFRLTGEWTALDHSERSEGVEAIWKPVPIGVCSLITPFNFPLNLAAHKIAPALAAGCPFVLKPDPRTPVTTLMLGELLLECGVPAEAVNILVITDEDARDLLVTDDRPRLLSFTGSTAAGWAIRARAGKKKVLLELGGIAPCIVDAGSDLNHAATRIAAGAFGYAGQSCISVQRVLVHEQEVDPLRELVVNAARARTRGDLRDPETTIGPLIEESHARRVESWIGEATGKGAKLLTGGARDGDFIEPAVLTDVPGNVRLGCEEVFGPVVVIERVANFDEALSRANATRFGLQAGVFTPSLDHAHRAWNELEFGGVVINNIPTTRIDAMPYGGVKDSGLGREGVRWSIEEMTEKRLMVLCGVGR